MKKVMSVVLALTMVLSMASFTVSASTAEDVAAAISVDTITTETADFITKNLALPNEIDGQSVVWESDSDAITKEGVVTRHATEEKAVKLTATVGGSAVKELNLTVAPLTTTILKQTNFSKKSDGTAFDTTKDLLGTNEENTQIPGWTLSATGLSQAVSTKGADGMMLDFVAKGISPGFNFPEKMDSPFYAEFDVKAQAAGSGIDIRMSYKKDGKSDLVTLYRFYANGAAYLFQTKAPGNIETGAKNYADCRENFVKVKMYIDPISMTMKFADGDGKMIPANGYKIGAQDLRNCEITRIYLCRASSTVASGTAEIDNFAVYRTAEENQIYNERIALSELASEIEFSDITSQDINAIEENIDFSAIKNKIEAENPGVTAAFRSSNENVLKIDGATGNVIRPVDDEAVIITVIVSKNGSSFEKEFKATVKQAPNPAKDASELITLEMMTDESPYAITKDLDLSLADFYALDGMDDVTVTFESSDISVLSVIGNKGAVIRPDGGKDVTLSITAKKGGYEYTREFSLTVLSAGAYLYASDNFNYKSLSGKTAGVLDRWTVQDNYKGATYTKLFYGADGGCVETGRTAKTGGYDETYYDFTRMRKVKTLRVEMDYELDELPKGSMLDVYFIGVKEGGIVHNDIENGLLKFRIQPGGVTFTAKSSASKVVNQGDKFRIGFDFDFENDTVQIWYNGEKVGGPLGFKGNYDFESIYKMNIRSYRQSENFNVKIDNLTAYSENADFADGVVDSEFETGRPMNVNITEYVSGGQTYQNMAITTKYDENTTLTQNLIQKPASTGTNPIVDFRGATLNDIGTGEKKTLLSRDVSDETNPPVINGMALGANHATVGLNVEAPAHGKTYADIGSVWIDESGYKFDLVRIPDENNLQFISFKSKSLTEPFNRIAKVNGNLTYVSDGVNTDPITVKSYGGGNNSQIYPGVKDVSHTYEIVKDGVRIPIDIKAIGNTYNCDEFIITEEYDIVNPYNVAENLRKNRPEGGYTENPLTGIGDSIYHYKQILTVKPDGTIFTEVDHQVLVDINTIDLYGYQFYIKKDVFGGGVFRQLPGTKKFKDSKGRTYDMSIPLEYTPDKNHANYDYPVNVTMDKSYWADENIVPSRILDYYRNTDGENVMGYMTGYLPVYDGVPSVRREKAGTSIYMYDEFMKAYPKLVSTANLPLEKRAALTTAGSRIHGVSYRKYVDLTEFDNEKQYYTINHENMTYYYVDFLEAGEITVDLEKAGCVYDLTEFEKIGDITYERVGDKVIFTAEGKGYIMLKAERKLETESAFIDGLSDVAGVRLVNYSDEDMTVSLGIASYNGNKLAGIKLLGNVEIGANATVNETIDVNSIENGTSYKLFILDNGGKVAPTSRNIDVLIK